MPLTLTCDCGARFEVEDLAAGQPALCPECKHPVRAPGRPGPPLPRTSQLALLSLVLALAGAFTVVGGVVAALVGAYALFQIRRRPANLTGQGVALAGVVLGPLLSVVTLAGYLRSDDLPFDGWLRALALTGQLETLPSPQVTAGNGEVTLTVPSSRWRKVRAGKTAHPVVGELQQGCDVLLFDPRRNAWLDVTRVAVRGAPARADIPTWLSEQFGKTRPPLVGDDEDGGNPTAGVVTPPAIGPATDLPAVDGAEVEERVVILRRGATAWRFLVRSYHKAGSPLWVVRAYAPQRRFGAAEDELRQALDSVRFPP